MPLCVFTWYLEMNYSRTISYTSQYTDKELIVLESGSQPFRKAWTWLPTTLGPADPGIGRLSLNPISGEYHPSYITASLSGQLLNGPLVHLT